jgi:cytochrome c oxidase subunit III
MDHEAYDYEWLETRNRKQKEVSQCRIAQRLPTAPNGPEPAHHEHPAYLRHHFESVEQQADATNFAMWLFLLTEVMFFGGLFTAYLIYRNWYYPAFVAGSHQLNVFWGTLNTLVLISSSFTMAMGVWCAETRRRGAGSLPDAHFLLGLGFLGIKTIEYSREDREASRSRLPLQFAVVHSIRNPIPKSSRVPRQAAGPDMARHTELYFSLYFAMTGMHALHMIIGIAILGFMIFRARAGAYTSGHVTFVRTSASTGTLSTLSGSSCSRCST